MRPRAPSPRSWLAALGVRAALGVLAAGCGKPATPEQCEEIVDRLARLEIQELKVPPSDPEALIREKRDALRESMQKHCVGKRVTEAAMRCVRGAGTAAEAQACF